MVPIMVSNVYFLNFFIRFMGVIMNAVNYVLGESGKHDVMK